MVDIPTTSVDGGTLLDAVHVYPKNVFTLASAQMTKVNEQDEPLEGAEFDLYKEGEPDDIKINAEPLSTGGDGKTAVVENLEIGNYYFKETKAPSGYLLDGTNQNFTVSSGDAEVAGDNNKLFELTFINSQKPKGVEKSADVVSAGIGDKVTWTIKSTLPNNIDKYTSYKITDNLNQALNYNGNLKVTLGGNTLVEGTHYNSTLPAVGSSGTIIVDLAPSQLSGGELVITLDTIINEKAKVGIIENKAILNYNNAFETVEDTLGIPAEVRVGGHKFLKEDVQGNALAGAEFKVKRDSDELYLVKNASGMISWGAVEDAFTFKSGTAVAGSILGQFNVEGLAFGKYFLEETKAPIGYSKLQSPIEFTVNLVSFVTPLSIVNKTKPGMPQTGGTGTLLFTVLGLAVMGIAVKTYKRDEN